jgi:hypothetical protein
MHQFPANGKGDVLRVGLQSVRHVLDESGGVAVPCAGASSWIGGGASDVAPLCPSRGIALAGVL